MHTLLRPVLILVALLAPRAAIAEEQPPAPAGFSWVKAKPMKGVFLLPEGWHFLEEQKGDISACFITKEKITPPGGAFHTGVSINLIRGLPQKAKLLSSQYAQRYLQVVAAKYKPIKTVSRKLGPFDHFGIEFISTDPAAPPIHMWHILIANDRTGSVYMAVVESPEAEWAENWPILEKISAMMGVDDEA
ncbi:MAG: hypothetical protein HXX12_09850 [Geothrix sp.]|uniref:hypothetical protein n=1 Tax=Geothrix sp. TaxID=1962974 RepID=UPI0017E0F5CA|nr:hypothetical protein [Geothrix sp.]NWJ41261.1 hypothetical protein [Geothrix sp.]WIL20748.1 MAG: hypothetical protein QOZ81_003334 [Geothrix sp.]